MEAEAASFNTVIDSTSSGFTIWIEGISTLSNKISGVELPSMEPICPRTFMVGSEPISPLGITTDNPGVVPCKPRPISAIWRPSRVLLTSTVAMAPVRLALF